jgi:UDP-N-acetylglucosamine diphosphorylase / glucose-1-phosphate thymidylyltransferase / UDP-N-acetylgalactosamine diphosphorylase / glucosamine-1-phosphate N-acetyltransferase / galactosamine-1-phosphate N-acetyltransferase
MQGIVLGAGKGSRLGSVTSDRSKAMLPVTGVPIIERVMEDMAFCGIDEFIVVAGPHDDEMARYFAGRDNVQIKIQREPAGMADALACAAPAVTGDFVLSACDNLVSRADMGRLISALRSDQGADAVLALATVPMESTGRSGIVELEGERVRLIVEKPAPGEAPSNIASLPLYCFSESFMDYLPGVAISQRGERELQDAIQAQIDDGGITKGVQFEGRLTLTDPTDLLKINLDYLSRGWIANGLSRAATGEGAELVPPVAIGPGTSIGAHCRIGPNVYIEGDAQIGDGAIIANSVVLRGSLVAASAVVRGQLVSNGDVVATLPGAGE